MNNWSKIVVLDLKGDNVLFKTVEQVAAANNRPLRVISNVSRRSTQLFNPFGKRHLQGMTPKSWPGTGSDRV